MNTLRLAVRRSRPHVGNARLLTASRLYSTSRICPSCSSPLPTALPTCPNCFHIEPLPSTSTYFDIFGLQGSQNRFNVDTRDLKRRFLQAQRICHPDAWSGRGEKDHNVAAAQSSTLNEAYKTLQSPVLRAQYILIQEGFPPSETDKLTDRGLVMEIMEAREQVDEAESLEDIERFRSENEGKMKAVYDKIENLIAEKKWEEARDAVVELKYLEGIQLAAKEKWDSLSR
ncbi:Co-chaperone Hsc20 [Fomitiporia mediterranea MF3/22]|uniref:Co-chaperone Hsc20 n=1 Tax=Fomitiporia mediterranea (strain MF3/22) TaxID=694068 RepID=UPI00044093BC|nr:Co-chaperone Hsc20 [Fomitiporia mediterranea MF3/22]EJD03953.1 Co-chaperone Hsc20 [Fomitiporia mediterranea MF3/22]